MSIINKRMQQLNNNLGYEAGGASSPNQQKKKIIIAALLAATALLTGIYLYFKIDWPLRLGAAPTPAAKTAQLLSDAELKTLPSAALGINISNLSVQTYRNQSAGSSSSLIQVARAADNLLSRGIVFERGPRPREIFLYDLPSQNEKRLTNDLFDDYNPTLGGEGQLVYFSVAGNTEGTRSRPLIQAKQKDIDTGSPKNLTEGESLSWRPFISPSGKKAAIIDGFNSFSVADLQAGSARQYLVTSPSSSGSGMGALFWSGDESKIIFQMLGSKQINGKYNMSVAEIDLDQGKVSFLADTEDEEVLPQYLPDNRVSYLGKSENQGQAQFFRALTILDRSSNIYKTFDLSPSVKGGYLWSEDFNRAYFIDKDGLVNVLNINTGEQFVVSAAGAFDGILGWGAYAETILLYKEALGRSFPCYEIFFAYNISNNNPPLKLFETCPVIEQTAAPSPTATGSQRSPQASAMPEVETTSWRTYTSMKYGFEFKYPTAWVVYADRDEGQIHIIQIVSPDDKNTDPYGTTFPGPILEIRIPGDNNSGSTLTISGVQVNDTGWQRSGMGGTLARQILFFANPKVSAYFRTAISGQDESYEKTIFNQIISTFKFTNPLF
ncbi:MAG: hypothetical protein A2831_01435 [Candidatus Yanofskybacteria bacterium RIFCSPHIGHO2_01_FULL_44_17]|uniref:Uncharacterized protein n=1 Tax=Candidatus Yanofskybacteria bacterium RIFCSPHIGHO2_01_FULL_44_17 TaxID=1802668 RepID=A0A1F8EWY7_9BACT|nr:MAG: hypothetical protein A2831_01435 [Candidatus Yanofskybacteria bacterium RIFCSPHIGHO2_01_FULL_44_17]